MLRTAVIGTGSLGRHHARVHRELTDKNQACLVAVCDANRDTAQAVATERRAAWTTDWRDLIRRDELRPQAVSLAAPTESHCEIACALLEAGIHVLVEKPIARNLAEADLMIAASERGGALLQIGHLERFNPAMVALKPFVRAPLYFEIHRVGQFTARSLDIDVVLDLMIHDLDLVQWLVGYDNQLTDVRAVGIPILTNRVDAANARLEFASGAVANITASRVGVEKIRKMRFFQPHDYINVDFGARTASISSLTAAPPPPPATTAPIDAAQLAQAVGEATNTTTSQVSLSLPLTESASDLSSIGAPSSASVSSGANVLSGANISSAAHAFPSVATKRPNIIDVEPLYAEIEAFLRAAETNQVSPVPGWQGRRALELAERVLINIRDHAAHAGLPELHFG